MYTKLANKQAGIINGLHEHIQDEFFEAGISLVSPMISQGNYLVENAPKKVSKDKQPD